MDKIELTHEVTIRHLVFPYYTTKEDPFGNIVGKEQLAYQGQTVKVSERDYQRGYELGSFVQAPESSPADVDTIDPATADVSELTAWMNEEEPTVQQVLDATEGDPAVAQKMLEAENTATGGDPRSSLVKGLSTIIERGNQ